MPPEAGNSIVMHLPRALERAAGAQAETAEDRHDRLWGECSGLARDPDILSRVAEALRRIGLVGEAQSSGILYLCLNSRWQPRPLSVAVEGPSSAGKSFQVACVTRLFPASAYHAMTSMSPKAMLYGGEPIAHRILILAEEAGLDSKFATYLVRSLLSEGRIHHETVVAGRGVIFDREGPTGVIMTSTALSRDPELATRIFTVSAVDTADQTRDVMRARAREAEAGEVDGDDGFLAEFRALQEWLEISGHRDVVVPFAGALAEMIPPVALRLRRDFESVLTLIRSHAFLHQAGRRKDDQGRILAERADYARVHGLVHDIVGDVTGASVPGTLRETVQAVCGLAGSDPVTVVALARKLGIDKAAAWRRARVAIERGFVRNLEGRKGRPASLTKGEPMPDEVEVLPAPERLFGGSVDMGSAKRGLSTKEVAG